MTNPICLICKNCSYKCAADCEHFVSHNPAQSSSDNIPQTIIITRILSSGGEGRTEPRPRIFKVKDTAARPESIRAHGKTRTVGLKAKPKIHEWLASQSTSHIEDTYLMLNCCSVSLHLARLTHTTYASMLYK